MAYVHLWIMVGSGSQQGIGLGGGLNVSTKISRKQASPQRLCQCYEKVFADEFKANFTGVDELEKSGVGAAAGAKSIILPAPGLMNELLPDE